MFSCTTRRLTTWHQVYTLKRASYCVWTTSSHTLLLLTLLQSNVLFKRVLYNRYKFPRLTAGSDAPRPRKFNGILQSYELVSACKYTSCSAASMGIFLIVVRLAVQLTHVLKWWHVNTALNSCALRWPSLWLALNRQAGHGLEAHMCKGQSTEAWPPNYWGSLPNRQWWVLLGRGLP